MIAEIELAERLQAGTLDPESFTHRDHLRVAWALLGPMNLPFGEAYGRMRSGLIAVAGDAYSETLTLAWMALVHEELARTGERRDFDRFLSAAGERLGRDALASRYGPAGLSSPAAKAGLVLPGACP
jgi:hypothetical protein